MAVAVPSALCLVTGFRKTKMETMMITTRLSVLSTLCVIGWTQLSTQNEDSWYMKKWNPDAAIMYSRVPAVTPLFNAEFHAAGAYKRPPRTNKEKGRSTAAATKVRTANWFVFRVVVSSPMSPTLPNFVASTFRATKKKFEAMAVAKPKAVKESSEEEARATPAKTGRSDMYTTGWNTCPRTNAEAMAFTAGSSAFTTCVKDTATAPRDATVATWPNEKASPTGASLTTSLLETEGVFTRPVPHMKSAIGMPAASWIQETAKMAGNTFSNFLFWMLY
mmetsp:Transcript_88358/g.248909  ORF Transcript_88358/g.248909 Transcript_88358/m.248909 type:complete len:277 (-) Transcript_88358:499-1329(-)